MTETDLLRALTLDMTEQQRFKPPTKDDLRKLGVEFPGDKIKKACQERLNLMFVNSYRNITL